MHKDDFSVFFLSKCFSLQPLNCYGYYSPWCLIFYYFRGLKEGDMAKVIEFIHGALEIAVKIQAASGPKLVDFKVNCICIF